MPHQTRLPEFLAKWGLTVELVPGWDTAGSPAFNPGGAVGHWTAGPRGTIGRPSLSVVVNGRPDLPGPLCNVYGTRDGRAVVVAAGRANHAGTGGWRGLVGNSAVWGTEMEAADNTDWTAAQRWAYPRINAAFADLSGFGAEMVCGHSEWAGPRKSDINGYTPSLLRGETAALLAAGPSSTPPRKRLIMEDDEMYISCEAKNFTGLLSGGVLTGLGGAEVTSAGVNIAMGAPRQWVTEATLDELIRKSQRLVRDIT